MVLADSEPYAVALVHVPSLVMTYHTSFTAEHHDDPLSAAHAFRDAEEARGEFPGALWAVTGNDAAAEIRAARLMESITGGKG